MRLCQRRALRRIWNLLALPGLLLAAWTLGWLLASWTLGWLLAYVTKYGDP